MKRQLEQDLDINRPAKRFMIGQKMPQACAYRTTINNEITLTREEHGIRTVCDSNEELTVIVTNIVRTKRKFDQTILPRKNEPDLVGFRKIEDRFLLDRQLKDESFVAIDCRNVLHYGRKYVPSAGTGRITLDNAAEAAQEIMNMILSIPYTCGTFCALSDHLGVDVVNAIAEELYGKCKNIRKIIVVSYAGDLKNGDDILSMKFSCPVITNDRMDKQEDVEFSEYESHNFRFIQPQQPKIFSPSRQNAIRAF